MKKTIALVLMICVSLFPFAGTVFAQEPTPSLAIDTWIADERGSDPIQLTSCLAFDTGLAIYMPLGTEATPAAVSFSAYPRESNPTPHQGVGLTNTFEYDEVAGKITWAGNLRPAAEGPSELWVSVGDNVFYQSEVDFLMRIVAQGFEPVERIVTLTNDCTAPPPPPEKMYIYLPLVFKAAELQPAPVNMSVSACDWLGVCASAGGVLNTSTGFVINAATYPQISDQLTATVTVGIIDSSWNSTFNIGAALTGDAVFVSGNWIWTGILRPGINVPSEFWVSVPDDQLHGTRTFLVSVEVSGFAPKNAQVTVISP